MYSHEQRKKAVELYIEYNFHEARVIRELGYPTFNTIPVWYDEYRNTGTLHERKKKYSKYTTNQKLAAIELYFSNGQCISRTVELLGYPSRPLLVQWIKAERDCMPNPLLVKYPQTKHSSARKCGRQMSKLKNELESSDSLTIQNQALKAEKDKLNKQVELLQQEIYKLQLERDVLEKAAEIIKKDKGINLEFLSNREKAIVINALRNSYPLKDLLKILHMAKSSYCYQAISLSKVDKYADLRNEVKTAFTDSFKRYGYRRIHAVIKASGTVVSEKVIRRIMNEDHLEVPNIKRRKYSSYKGEVSPAVDNVIKRDFHANKPNQKWLTDITEFHIPAGKIYLSPIIDCFDGLPVSWRIGTTPNAELVNTMLDDALDVLQTDDRPIVHSDRGCHYRWPGWIERMEKASLIRSMSKKGCSPDNSACEGFFGRLKNEMFYGYSWTNVSIEQFIEELNNYIKWYAEKRIKLSLGGMSPLDYRRSLGLAV